MELRKAAQAVVDACQLPAGFRHKGYFPTDSGIKLEYYVSKEIVDALRDVLEKTGWTKTKDRLPSVPKMLAFVVYQMKQNEYYVVLVQWKDGTWWWSSELQMRREVLYWQPLYYPELPEISNE